MGDYMKEENVFGLIDALEMSYIKMLQNELKLNNVELVRSSIFPPDWDISDNYDLKIKSLVEAINNKVLIIHTKNYLSNFRSL